jgi:NAD-dependent dihydropyrimidine dehydrogenase PreA subunit
MSTAGPIAVLSTVYKPIADCIMKNHWTMSHGATLALEQDHRVDIRFGVGHFTRPIPDQAKGSKTTVRRSTPSVYRCTRCYLCPSCSLRCSNGCFFVADVLSEDPEAGLGGQQEPIVVSQVLSLGSRRQTLNLWTRCVRFYVYLVCKMQNPVSAGATHLWLTDD